jgi:hypothetical protein
LFSCSLGDGMSSDAAKVIGSVKNLHYIGRVKRWVMYKEKRNDDPNFSFWYNRKFGDNRFAIDTKKFNLAHGNHIAGFYSLRKYDKEQPHVDEEVFGRTYDWVQKHFHCMAYSTVLTLEDAIKVTDKTASVGFPYSELMNEQTGLIYKAKSKGNWLLDPVNQEYLKTYVNEIAAKPDCDPVLWSNNVKKEIRLTEKICSNSLRTFVSPPIEHIILAQMLFWEMNNKLYHSSDKTWSFVGRSPFLRGFHNLFNRLNKHKNAFECDESEYDSSLFRRLMYGMRDLRWDWLAPGCKTPLNFVRLNNVYRDIVESWIVTTRGDVFQKETGNPSGSLNTISDNTIILFRLLAYAWLILAPHEKYKTYQMFMMHVEAALNGDDNTWTCSDEVVNWFNAKSVAKVWSEIGITTKYGAENARKLEDCKFLSSSFGKCNGVWVPVPETSRVLACLGKNTKFPDNPRFSLLRACAMRIQSFFNLECRYLIDEYIQWLISTKWDLLHAPCADSDPFTFDNVYSVYKTDWELINLYTGRESKCQEIILNSSPLDIFDMCADRSKLHLLEHNSSAGFGGRRIFDRNLPAGPVGEMMTEGARRLIENTIGIPIDFLTHTVVETFMSKGNKLNQRDVKKILVNVEENPGPRRGGRGRWVPKGKVLKEEKKIVKAVNRVVSGRKKSRPKQMMVNKQNKPSSFIKKNQLARLGVQLRNEVKTVRSKFNMKMGSNRVFLSGTDVVASLLYMQGSASHTPGTVLYSQLINPINMNAPRLSQMALFFARFKFTQCDYFFQPGLGSQQTGSVVGYYDPDILDAPNQSSVGVLPTDESAENLQDAAAHRKRQFRSLNQASMHFKMPKPEREEYFVNTVGRDPTLTNQFLFSIEVANTNNGSAVNLGPLYCKWAVEMWDPQTSVPPQISSNGGFACMQGSTAIGGTITGTAVMFPINSTGSPSAYTIHNDGAPALESNGAQGTWCNFHFARNACYYIIVHQTGTGIAPPTFTYLRTGNWLGLTPTLALIASGTTSTTQDLLFYNLDLSIDAGLAPHLDQRTRLELFVSGASTTVTAYSFSFFSDTSGYNTAILSMLKHLSPIERRLYMLEHKDDKKKQRPFSSSPSVLMIESKKEEKEVDLEDVGRLFEEKKFDPYKKFKLIMVNKRDLKDQSIPTNLRGQVMYDEEEIHVEPQPTPITESSWLGFSRRDKSTERKV